MKRKRKYGKYLTFKEARAAARIENYSNEYDRTPIYEEPDQSFSVKNPVHKKAILLCAIDKSGRMYTLAWIRNDEGKKVQTWILKNK